MTVAVALAPAPPAAAAAAAFAAGAVFLLLGLARIALGFGHHCFVISSALQVVAVNLMLNFVILPGATTMVSFAANLNP